MVAIVDYKMCNIGSIQNMIKKLSGEVFISDKPEEIAKADKLILPGVGTFDKGMENLKKYNLIEILNKRVLVDKVPVLGICLGMQLMTEKSEEGVDSGLGWIKAETKKFVFENSNLKVPHMGWNKIKIINDNKIFTNMGEEARFYFVHSYYVCCYEKESIAAQTNYGIDFVSSIHKNNIYATQFHPEKSHKYGMKIMKNFLELI